MADIFKGKPVFKKNGKSFPANQTLYDKQLICLYFAVQWFPPCRMFTPVLANVYEDAKKDNLIIEGLLLWVAGTSIDRLPYVKYWHRFINLTNISRHQHGTKSS
ncbi:uncharacterized protein LOC142559936 [Dermacentor variabilis]|uniref:uncharacterized protein LOC142559936 n=1 Tax=Dermacentor variabilis TaxID=34621 RepID=UPI003F5C08AC